MKITAPLQNNHQAKCVDHTHIDALSSWKMSGNEEMNKLVLVEGFELLRVWNFTRMSPPQCRMGGGNIYF